MVEKKNSKRGRSPFFCFGGAIAKRRGGSTSLSHTHTHTPGEGKEVPVGSPATDDVHAQPSQAGRAPNQAREAKIGEQGGGFQNAQPRHPTPERERGSSVVCHHAGERSAVTRLARESHPVQQGRAGREGGGLRPCYVPPTHARRRGVMAGGSSRRPWWQPREPRVRKLGFGPWRFEFHQINSKTGPLAWIRGGFPHPPIYG